MRQRVRGISFAERAEHLRKAGERRGSSALAEQFGDEYALRIRGRKELESVHAAIDVHYFSLQLHHRAGKTRLEFHAYGPTHL